MDTKTCDICGKMGAANYKAISKSVFTELVEQVEVDLCETCALNSTLLYLEIPSIGQKPVIKLGK